MTVGWLVNPQREPGVSSELSAFDRLALEVLSYLLLGTPASPLYRALTASGLGKTVIGGGKEDLKQIIFSAGLKGMSPLQARKVFPTVICIRVSICISGETDVEVDCMVS